MEKELQPQDKREVSGSSEPTRNAPRFIPRVDIYESEDALTLLADMPGVSAENVEVDLNEDRLSIRGRVNGGGREGKLVYCEYGIGDYFREFALTRKIDRNKIEAHMKDGVLKLVLPKAEEARPRKIAITTS